MRVGGQGDGAGWQMEREREEMPAVINLYCEFIIALVGQDSLVLVIPHRAKHFGNYRKKKRKKEKRNYSFSVTILQLYATK